MRFLHCLFGGAMDELLFPNFVQSLTVVCYLFLFHAGYAVYGLNVLFTTLNSPSLTGWIANGGDPCGEFWQGVACADSNVTSLKISDFNLTGDLGTSLENLTALIVLDLSNNLLSSTIPFQLPPHIQQLILSNNAFTGELPSSIAALTNLDILNVSNNMISGAIPDFFDSLGSLTMLDLSNNSLSNSLPASFGSLSSLNTLYLQNNHLNGTIDILSNLPLKDLDISNNNFSGWVAPALTTIPSFKDFGNQFNASPIPPPPPNAFVPSTTPHQSSSRNPGHKSSDKSGVSSSNSRSEKYFTKGRITGIIVAGILAVVITVLAVLFFAFRPGGKKKAAEKHVFGDPLQGLLATSDKVADQKDNSKLNISSLVVATPETPPLEKHTKVKEGASRTQTVKDVHSPIASTAYSIAELQSMTNSFSQENVLGEGSLGQVYKAELLNGKQLAVKKMGTPMYTLQQEDFMKILADVSRLHHPNVVELVGYCLEHGQYLLVYEYISNRTLHENLHSGEEKSRRLSWDFRVKIALGAAQALEYLHEVCIPPIVHHNFKSTNILLDEDYNPHVADCGISPFSFEHKVSSLPLGSLEYSAPEYTMSGIYTVKSDVYSFGIVMLELLTGRKPLDSSRPRVEQSLVRWAIPQLYDIDALTRMVDPALEGIYPVKALSRFADVIALCVQPEPEFRPSMSEIVQSLSRLTH